MVDSGLYPQLNIPTERQREDEFINFIEQHEKFPRRHLKALFPNLDELEASPRVAQILAEKAIKKSTFEDDYKIRFCQAQDRALNRIIDLLDNSTDERIQLDASKFLLSGRQAHAKRVGELRAEMDMNEIHKDEQYPEVE
jgi:hypothetical protein